MAHFICKGGCKGVSDEEGVCMADGCESQYEMLESCDCADGEHGMGIITKDSNGDVLKNGDSVHLIKDLTVRGTSNTYKRGTVASNIRLTDNPDEVECRFGKTTIVLRTEFLKKKT